MQDPPITTVSLAIIARNEEDFLPSLLNDVSKQTYARNLLEIILVDSMSDDRTRSIMEQFAFDHPDFLRITIVENHRVIQASGWNKAIETSAGTALIRVDAHASIPEDFVEANVRVLNEGEAVCGGRRPTAVKDSTPWRETLHAAEESAFGSNAASYRKDSKASYVPSIFHGAYRREVLDAVQGFDERLRRTEDNDFNYRVREAGYRIKLDPSIHSTQYIRSSLRGMLKQKFGNGYWIGRTLYIQPKCFQLHHFIPLAFVLGIIALFVVGISLTWMPFLVCACFYAAVCIALAINAYAHAPKRSISMLLLPLIFFGIHSLYGMGTIIGIIVGLFKRKGNK